MNNTELKIRIIELADEMRDIPMPELTDELFGLFEKNGNRLSYENVYFKRRKFLAVYGIAVIIEGRTGDAKKLNEVLRSICSEKTWALPAHCDSKKRPDISREIDLFNSETAGALSEILAAAKDRIVPDTASLIRNEIKKRVLEPFIENGKKYGFEHAAHNWNAVCCGSLGVVLLNLGNELIGEEKTEETLSRLDASLLSYVESFPKDGACLEGAGYFNYGMSFLTAYIRRYRMIKGNVPQFAKSEKLVRIAGFPNAAFFENGMSINFSDASENEKLHAGMLEELQKEYDVEYSIGDNVVAEFDTDPCYRFLPLLDDLKYGNGLRLSAHNDTERTVFLEHSEWLIAESDNGCGFAIKGGNNAEPHNHNDVGSFIFKDRKGVLACELGAGEYTADYFGEKRYEILCNSTRGHSLPLIDGKGQEPGEDKKTLYFRYQKNENTVKAELDLTKCYSRPEGESVFRSARFDMKSGVLEIRDDIDTVGEPVDRIVSKTDITDRIELLTPDHSIRTVKENFEDHEGINEEIFIFEIKEKKDGDNQERDHGKRLHSITYRIYPR